jgi:alpha-beta hydrolase superfamily lysophospholipase
MTRRLLALLALLAALGALPALTGCVSALFFHPDRQLYTTPGRYGLTAYDLWFETENGTRLNGWWVPAQVPQPVARGASANAAPLKTPPPAADAPPPANSPALLPARGTVIHVHGNAANISNHLPQVAWLPAAGYNVLTFDYRGYGLSHGTPSLDGVVADTLAAIAAARRQPGVDGQRLVVLGQSLGGATAIRALARDAAGVKLLIVDSAFDSYRGVTRDAVRGTSLLVAAATVAGITLPGPGRDPRTAMAQLELPVLVLHGDRDQTIPPEHGQRLYDAARGPRTLIRVPEGRHIEGLTRGDIRARVLEVMQAALDGTLPARDGATPSPQARALLPPAAAR